MSEADWNYLAGMVVGGALWGSDAWWVYVLAGAVTVPLIYGSRKLYRRVLRFAERSEAPK